MTDIALNYIGLGEHRRISQTARVDKHGEHAKGREQASMKGSRGNDEGREC